MNIGYACLALGVHDTDMKTCTMRTINNQRLRELIENNLNSLKNMIDYNAKNHIRLFRISSDLIPFGSASVNTLPWQELFVEQFSEIGKRIRENGIRVSMHPGQYTVLNSLDPSVVARALEDLDYHCKILDLMGLDSSHKIILHIGGVYGNMLEAKERFIKQYKDLDPIIKKRLVIENDDRSYNIEDVLEISEIIQVPVVFDVFHHQVNPAPTTNDVHDWIEECKKTWDKMDGVQKIHYSQQDPTRRAGSHSSTIEIDLFLDFYESIREDELDIMLEVKDKNLSAVKCINTISTDVSIQTLEVEWSKYKYTVLEHSPEAYDQIRQLLKDKENFSARSFYHWIEYSLQQEIEVGKAINAAQHVFGYFKQVITEKDKVQLINSIEKYKHGTFKLETIKKYLWRLAEKNEVKYLLSSYYFTL